MTFDTRCPGRLIPPVGTAPSGGAVLYGLSQDGAAGLSPRSTAVVLAYNFLGVGVYVGDMQLAYLSAIAASPSLDTLQAAVSGVSWSAQNGDGNSVGVNLRLALPAGTKITGTQSWTTCGNIFDTIVPGQFLFIGCTSDNLGSVAITDFTPLAGGAHLSAFTFTEGSTSGSSTRTYSGSGSFIVPA